MRIELLFVDFTCQKRITRKMQNHWRNDISCLTWFQSSSKLCNLLKYQNQIFCDILLTSLIIFTFTNFSNLRKQRITLTSLLWLYQLLINFMSTYMTRSKKSMNYFMQMSNAMIMRWLLIVSSKIESFVWMKNIELYAIAI